MNDLSKLFLSLQMAIPDLVAGTQPLGAGNFGIVISSGDVLTKILFRPKDKISEEPSIALFEREVLALREFQKNPLEGIEVPVLIDEPQRLDHSDYMAMYKMTCVSGGSLKQERPENASKEIYDARYKSSGALLAKFHNATCYFDFGETIVWDVYETARIVQNPGFDAETNRAFDRVDCYLQGNATAGNVHGDFNMPNIMGNGGKATGLIDFSHTGKVQNLMTDFWAIPAEYRDICIEGYAEESGKSSEELKPLIDATFLSFYTNNYESLPKDELDLRQKIKDEIYRLLNKLSPVTDLSFPL